MDYDIIFYLAKKGALFRDVRTSTVKIAESIGSSQQTISRKLRNLERAGYLVRTVSNTGMRISLTPESERLLKSLRDELNHVFNMSQPLKGKVKSGLNEGKFYIEQRQYKEQFVKKLGFKPYPGTLNMSVDLPELKKFLSNKEPIRIDGFTTQKRSYGGITCYPVKLKDTNASIIFPDRSVHKEDEVELIASPYLRGKYKLKDDDVLEIDDNDEA